MTIAIDVSTTSDSGLRKRGKTVLRAILTTAFATVTTIAVAAPANAQCNEGGMGLTRLNIMTELPSGSGSKSYWEGQVLTASFANWDRLGTGIVLRKAESSGGRYRPGEFEGNYEGVYQATGTRRVNRVFFIEINARKIRSALPDSVKNDAFHWNRVVTNHELSHALGIEDKPNDVPSGQFSIASYPPTGGPFYNRFNDWGYFDLPTTWDGREASRCTSKSSVP